MHRRLIAFLLLTFAIAIAAPIVHSAGFEIEDHETVYGILDPSGTPTELTVVDWLRVHGQGEVRVVDPGDLTDVRNVKGPERPTKVPGGLSWLVRSHGAFRDIFYSGRTNRSLPVEIKITYILNGKEVPGSQVGGAKGDLLVRMSITNRLRGTERVSYTGAQGEVLTSQEEFVIPIVTSVTMDVDSSRYRRIEAPEATIVATGSTLKLSWIVFPYPNTTLTLRLTGDKIRLDPITFSVAPKVPPFPAVEIRGQLQELVQGMRRVDSGLAQLLDGSDLLAQGQGQMLAGVGALQAGVVDLSRLNEAHQLIVGRTVEGLAGLDLDGISASLERLGELDGGLAQLDGGLTALMQLNAAHQQIVKTIRTEIESTDTGTLKTGLGSLNEMSKGLAEADRYLGQASASHAAQTRLGKAAKDRQRDMVTLLGSLGDKNPAIVKSAEYRELVRLADLQYANLTAMMNGGKEGGKSFDGMTYTSKVLDGLAKKLQDGRAGMAAMTQLGSKSEGLLAALDRLKEALKVLAEGGTLEGKTIPGLDKAGEGLKLARDGVVTIRTGLNEAGDQKGLLAKAREGLALLRTALNVLLHGGTVEGQNVPGLDTAGKGLAEVGKGLELVADGADKSRAGAIQIKDGLYQVRNEGTQRMYAEMSGALNELTKAEALKKVVAARVQAYDHFIGKPAGAKAEVRFLLRTEVLK